MYVYMYVYHQLGKLETVHFFKIRLGIQLLKTIFLKDTISITGKLTTQSEAFQNKLPLYSIFICLCQSLSAKSRKLCQQTIKSQQCFYSVHFSFPLGDQANQRLLNHVVNL